MSDMMLHAVLNMPIDCWSNDPIDNQQRFDRYTEASKRILELERLLKVQSTDGWQPISTAPKDGQWIILVVNGWLPVIGQWCASENMWVSAIKEEVTPEQWELETTGDWQPTHWRAIPGLVGEHVTIEDKKMENT